MDDCLEGSLLEMDHAPLQKQKTINEPPRRTSSLFHRTTTANWCDTGRVTIDIPPDDVLPSNLANLRNGTCWCTCVKIGDMLYFGHHFTSISEFSAQREDL